MVQSISIVVPYYNEEENVVDMYNNIKNEISKLNLEYEIIFVDDGSTDRTYQLMKELAEKDSTLKLVKFRFNAGQTAAMSAGFQYATKEVVIPMDGDMQNDPADIIKLVEKINEGYDVVSGWRKNRKDKAVSRKLPSKIANKLISKISGVRLHDYGCSLKAYRRDVIQNVRLYGEMHRFIPIYASWVGGKVTEIVVNHRPRTKGVSKYGISRTFKVVLDLITIKFLGSYSTKPLYFFGKIGFLAFLFAFLGGSYVIAMKLLLAESMVTNPIFLFTVMCLLIGTQFILMGLIAELQIRTYHESQDKRPYIIQEFKNFPNENKKE